MSAETTNAIPVTHQKGERGQSIVEFGSAIAIILIVGLFAIWLVTTLILSISAKVAAFVVMIQAGNVMTIVLATLISLGIVAIAFLLIVNFIDNLKQRREG